MKAQTRLQTKRRPACDLLPFLWLCLLAIYLPVPLMGQANYATPYTFTTLAGYAGYGLADGTGNTARFYYPFGAAVDSAGNVYVADVGNDTIRKVTPAGVVTTLAGLAANPGSEDGTGSAAQFNNPEGVAVDSAGNVYVADTYNYTIRKVTSAGVVTTLAGSAGISGTADGTGSAARFDDPSSVALDSAGNVYVVDTVNQTIRKVTPAGVVTTLAGLAGTSGSADGTGSAARFYLPNGVAVDSAGNIYVADTDNATIRKVTQAGVVTTLAGLAGNRGTNDGTGSAARLNEPSGVALDSAGNLYVADSGNSTIRKVTSAGIVTTLAGSAGSNGTKNGAGSVARFYYPQGVAVDSLGNIYVADSQNSMIREVTPSGTNWVVTTLAGLAGGYGTNDGTGSAAQFHEPIGVAADSADNLYVADYINYTIREVTPAGVVTTLAGLARTSGSVDGTGSAARFNEPSAVAVDSAGNLYVADSGNATIRKMTPTAVVTTLAGLARSYGTNDGTGSAARFGRPSAVAVDSAGNLYVADSSYDTIRKVTPSGTNWVVTTLAGLAGTSGSADGTGSAARLNEPSGVAVDGAGNIYVADTYNNTIRKVTSAGVVTTLAGLAGTEGSTDGTGSVARFYFPASIAVDSAGNLYVADFYNNTIRKVTSAGVVTTLGGLAGNHSSWDGTGSVARFYFPQGVAVDSAGNVYVGDTDNNTIRKGYLASSVAAPIFQPSNLSVGQLGFSVTGLSGLAMDIQSSADLSHWQVAGTYILSGGTNQIAAPTPPQGTGFYRAHVH